MILHQFTVYSKSKIPNSNDKIKLQVSLKEIFLKTQFKMPREFTVKCQFIDNDLSARFRVV